MNRAHGRGMVASKCLKRWNLYGAGNANIMEKIRAVLWEESHTHHQTVGSALTENGRKVGEVNGQGEGYRSFE